MSAFLRTLNVRSGWLFALAFVAAGPVEAASIRGTVTKAGPAPVVGGRVTAFDQSGFYTAESPTDSNGAYAIALPPGDYYLEARGGTAVAADSYLIPVCYNGQLGGFNFYWTQGRQGELQSVTLADEDVAGINFQLLEKGGKVTGRVTAADGGSPISEAGVTLYDEAGQFVDGVGTDTQGDFAFCGVPVGTYISDANGPYNAFYAAATYQEPSGLPGGIWYNDNYLYATPIDVVQNTTRGGVNFRLPTGGKLCGTVTDSGGLAVFGVSVGAYDLSGRGVGGAMTAPDGSYSLTLLPDEYYADVRGGQDNCTLVDVSYDGHLGSFNSYWNSSRAGELDIITVVPGQCATVDFQMPDGAGGIEGTVTESDGTTPIPNVSVSLYDETGGWVNGWSTASDGMYYFCGLAPGTYIMDAWPWGGECFLPVTYDGLQGNIWQADNLTNATRIVVPPYTIVSGKDMQLPRGGAIEGTVTQEDGTTPVADVRVTAYSLDGRYVGEARTQEDGTYSVCLGAGTCYLDVQPDGDSPNCLRASVTYNGQPGTFNWHWQNGNEGALETVEVQSGQTVTGINFSMPPGGAISGTVTESDGTTGIVWAWVTVYDENGSWAGATYTSFDGTYSACGLLPGQYILDAQEYSGACFRAATYDGLPGNIWTGDNFAQATRIAVSAGTAVADVDIALPDPGTIAGKVTEMDGTTPVVGATVTVYLSSGSYVDQAETGYDGTYTVACLQEGEYVLDAVGPPGACYRARTYLDLPGTLFVDDNLTNATRIDVQAGASASGIDFEMSECGGIEGMVIADDHITPIANVSVTVYDETGAWMGGTMTLADGTYRIEGLVPGTYVMDAWPPEGGCYDVVTYDGLPGSIWDNGNLVAATRIEVVAGAAVTGIDMSLSRSMAIEGTVTEEDGTTPIANAIVAAYDSAGGWVASAQTGVGGTYSLCVAAGEYLVEASGSADGPPYFTQQTWQGLSGGVHTRDNRDNATRVYVLPDSPVTGVDFALGRGGKIHGSVTAGGVGVPGACVQAFGVEDGWHIRGLGTGRDAPNTGMYAETLPPGAYYLNARTDIGGPPPETCLLAPVTHDGKIGIFDLYWCQERQDELGIVQVELDQAVEVNFSLPAGGRISGTVTESDGTTPVGDATVTLYDEMGCSLNNLQTGPDGAYTFCGLAPGQYTMDARPPAGSCYGAVTYDGLPGDLWHGDNVTMATRIDVTGGAAVSGIEFRLLDGGTISGTVWEQAGGTPVAGASVNVHLSDGGYVAGAVSGTDGTFSLCVPAGVYIAEACPPAGTSYLCETYAGLAGALWCDDNRANATRIPVGFGANVTGVDFSFDPPPSVAVTLGNSPSQPPCWRPGDVMQIEWTPSADVGQIELWLRPGWGTGCQLAFSSVSARVFAWTVPHYLGDGPYVIQAKWWNPCINAWVDGFSEEFCIAGSVSPPTLHITTPQGGETWSAGAEYDILWDVPEGAVGSVILFLAAEQGAAYGSFPGSCGIGLAPLADGRFHWRVPSWAATRSDYRLAMCLFPFPCGSPNPSYCGVNDGPFTISGTATSAPQITLTAPTGSVTWYRGMSQNIAWSVNHPAPAQIENDRIIVLLIAGSRPDEILELGRAPILDCEMDAAVGCQVPERNDYALMLVAEGDFCAGFAPTPGGGTSAMITVARLPADLDLDCDVDLADFLKFQECFNGPNRPAKPTCIAPADADLDDDTDVDLADFLKFQGCFNGPNRSPKPTCLAPG